MMTSRKVRVAKLSEISCVITFGSTSKANIHQIKLLFTILKGTSNINVFLL